MKRNTLLCLVSASMISLGGYVFAANNPTFLQHPKAPKAEATPTLNEMSMLRTNCFTNVRDCAGLATWRNNGSRGVGCAVWWNNGAQGRSNFTLGPGQSHVYHVRYNDTTACVSIEQAPPSESVQRSYIWVD